MPRDVHELRRLAEREKGAIVRLFNPSLKDFAKTYDDGSGHKEYVMKAGEITPFSSVVARHMKKHLIDFLINEREMDPFKADEVAKEVEAYL